MTEKSNRPVSVLFAEDDDDDYLIFSLAVEDLSLRITLSRAENGEILMEILGTQIPDFLFLDVLMPSKDGTQCLREIRANPRYDSLPIIAYSSLDQAEDQKICFREGANLFVRKAASVFELKNILLRIFSIDWKSGIYYPPFTQFVVNN